MRFTVKVHVGPSYVDQWAKRVQECFPSHYVVAGTEHVYLHDFDAEQHADVRDAMAEAIPWVAHPRDTTMQIIGARPDNGPNERSAE